MFLNRRKNQDEPKNIFDNRLAHLYRQAEETPILEKKIWCYAQMYFLANFTAEMKIQLTRNSGRLISNIINEIEKYYGMPGRAGIDKMLCYDIGKEMMDNYRGEQERTTFYCDAEQRAKFKTTADASGRLVRMVDGNLANLQPIKNSHIEPIFVIGLNGVLHLCYDDQAKGLPMEDKHFHHSSFYAGEPVICGGMMKVKNGEVLEISNESGHYQPDYRNLLFAVQALLLQGVSLINTKVKISYYARKQLIEKEYPALVFLQMAAITGLCSSDNALAERNFKHSNRVNIELDSIKSRYLGLFMHLYNNLRSNPEYKHGEASAQHALLDAALQMYIKNIHAIDNPNQYYDELSMMLVNLQDIAKEMGLDPNSVKTSLIASINEQNDIDQRQPIDTSKLLTDSPENIRPVKIMEIDSDYYLDEFIRYVHTYPFNIKKSEAAKHILLKHNDQHNLVPVCADRLVKLALRNDLDPAQNLHQIIKEAINIRYNKKEWDSLNEESKAFIHQIIHFQLFYRMGQYFNDNPIAFKLHSGLSGSK